MCISNGCKYVMAVIIRMGGVVLIEVNYERMRSKRFLDYTEFREQKTYVKSVSIRFLLLFFLLCFHFSTIAIPFSNSYFGGGTGTIWLDDVKCTGTELGLGACAHKPWGKSNCDHTEDAGVMCIPNGCKYMYNAVLYFWCSWSETVYRIWVNIIFCA